MIKIEKRHWVFMGLVLLLCVTGLINYAINSAASGDQPVAVVDPEDGSQQTQSGNYAGITYFTLFRNDRTESRAKEVAYLDEIIQNEKTDAETLKEAQEQKLEIVKAMETETAVEGLIKAKGFEECVVTIKKGSVNVVVENKEALTSEQAAQILEIVRRETNESAENIKIMPRN